MRYYEIVTLFTWALVLLVFAVKHLERSFQKGSLSMIISYNYMHDALKNYEKALPGTKVFLYWLTQEPEYIRELKLITSNKSKSNEILSAADLVELANLLLQSPSLQPYFPNLTNDLETNYFLKSADLLYRADFLNEQSLPFLMTEYCKQPRRTLVSILDKLPVNLLTSHNLTRLFKFAKFFDYDKGPHLIQNETCQPQLDAIFALCSVYSSDIHKVREKLESYVLSSRSSYDVLFSRGVAAVIEPREQKNPEKILFSRGVTPVIEPVRTHQSTVEVIVEHATRHELC